MTFSLFAPEEVTVSLVSLLVSEEVTVSLLVPEASVVSLLVPEQAREVRFTGTGRPFFLGLPDPTVLFNLN